MSGPPSATRIVIPRWVQLVGLPLLLLLVWTVAGVVRHAVFLFLVALLIALLLNPVVRGLGRVWIPRGLAVAIVYLAFAAALALAVLALATVVVQQTRDASHRVDNYFTVVSGQTNETGADHDLARLQHWLNTHHLRQIHVERSGHKFLNSIGTKDVEKYTTKALNWAEGAGLAVVTLLFSALLVVVVSIYMLLDMPRLKTSIDRRFPPHPGSKPLLERMEHALASYVKGQLLLSLIIGASSGIGLWVLGMTGALRTEATTRCCSAPGPASRSSFRTSVRGSVHCRRLCTRS
jgi:predicted PurR-regulated permease PerM